MIVLGIDAAYKGGAVLTSEEGLLDYCNWKITKGSKDNQTRRMEAYLKVEAMIQRNHEVIGADIPYAVISSAFFFNNIKTTILLSRISQHFMTELTNIDFTCFDMKDAEARKTLSLPPKKKPAQAMFMAQYDCLGLNEDEVDAYVFAEALRKELMQNEQ